MLNVFYNLNPTLLLQRLW